MSLLVPGNIDLTNRPRVKNADGTTSTVLSKGFGFNEGKDKVEALLPTISDDGKVWSDQEAVDNYKKTGKHLGIFADRESAEKYGQQLHKDQDAQLDDDFTLPDPQGVEVQDYHPDPKATNPYFAPDDSEDLKLPDPQKDSVSNSYVETLQDNPEEAATIMRLSKQFNLDPTYVIDHMKELKPLGEGPTREYLDQFEQAHPEIAAFLRQRHNMVMSKDDLDNLGNASESLKELGNMAQIGSWDAGQLGVDAGMLGWDRIWDNSNPVLKPKLDKITKQLEQFNQYRPTGVNIDSAVDTTVEQLPMFWGMAKYAVGGGVAASVASLPLSWVLGPAAPIGAAGAFGSGATAGVGAFNFKIMAGHSYNELDAIRDDQGNPFPENIKQMTAILTGAAQAGLAYIPLIGMLKKIPGAEKAVEILGKSSLKVNLANPKTAGMAYKSIMTEFVKAFAEASAHVGVGMAGIKAVGLTGEEAAKTYSGQPFAERRSALQIGGESLESGLHAMKDFGAISMISPWLRLGPNLGEAARNSKFFKAKWDKLAEAAKNSKLLERSPEKFEEFLEPLVKAFPNKAGLFKPQELKALFQTLKLDPDAEFAKLGITEDVVKAEQIGGKVEVPLAKLLSTYGKQEIEASEGSVKGQTVLNKMGDLVTFDHDAKSIHDLNEESKKQDKKKADTKKEFDADVAEGEEATTKSEKFQEDRKRIEKDMAEKMDAVNKPEGMNERQWKETKKQTAKVQSAIMVTRAKRRGLEDAWQVYQDSNTHFLNEQDAIPLHMKRHILERIKFEVDQGDHTSGGFAPQQDQSLLPSGVEANKFISSSSTYPEYFKNKGLSKKSVLNAIQKHLDGNSLTHAQQDIIEDLYRSSGFDKDLVSDNEPLLQSKPSEYAPTFFSRVEKTIETKMGKSARGDQVKGLLKDLNKEELKWMGIDQFLEGKETVTKEELLEFIRDNQVEVKEVVRGGEKTPIQEGAKVYQIFSEDGEGGGVFLDRANANTMLEEGQYILEGEWDGESTIEDLQFHKGSEDNQPTRHSDQQLPGGNNYREVLFTLPEKFVDAQERSLSQDEYNELIALGQKMSREHNLPSDEMARWKELKAVQVARVEALEKIKQSEKNQLPYRSSHWDEDNVLAHGRVNDRVTSDGKNALHLEENQSDWGQAGRKKGYKGEPREVPPAPLPKPLMTDNDVTVSSDNKFKYLVKPVDENLRLFDSVTQEIAVGKGVVGSEQEAKEYALRMYNREIEIKNDRLQTAHRIQHLDNRVPNMPFKKNWHELVMKRMLRMAAEGGYDKLTWTTGEQQSERYNLSKHIDEVQARYIKSKDTYTIAIRKNGATITTLGDLTAHQLSEQVGKDLANKIVKDNGGSYKGLDLKVGGEGMKGFYDKILVDFMNKYTKKWGSKVGESEIETTGNFNVKDKNYRINDYRVVGRDGDIKWMGDSEKDALTASKDFSGSKVFKPGEPLSLTEKVHSIDITPAMKESLLHEGQPLFQGAEAKPLGAFYPDHYPDQTIIRLFKGANQSTTVHELAHVALLDTFNYIKDGITKTEWQEGEQGLFDANLKDWKILADWLKIEDAQKELTVDQQEQFAKGFEVYLREGKAPTTALRKTFEFFKKWMTKIYKKAQMLDVQMTDEMRSVFDNLVASDEEISFASEEFGFLHELDYSQFPEKVGNLVKSMIGAADERSIAKQSSEHTAEAILEKTQQAMKEAESELEQLPMFHAVKEILKKFSGTAEELGKRFSDNLAKAEENGLLPDDLQFCLEFEEIAESHEQSSLDLANDLAANGSPEKRISSLAEQIYEVKNNRKDNASKNVHNFKRLEAQLIEKEILQAMKDHKKWVRKEESQANKKEITENLNRIRDKVKDDLKMIREEAEKQLSDTKIGKSGAFLPYFTAEKNAAVAYEKAVKRKDWKSAEKYKDQHIRAHALAIQAIKNSKEIPKIVKRFEFFQKRGTRLLKIPFHNVHLIDDLMSKHGLTKERLDSPEEHQARAEALHKNGVEPDEITDQTGFVLKIENEQEVWEQENLSDFAARKSNAYFNFYLPDSVLKDSEKPFAELTLSEVKDVRDTVEILYKIGRNADRFLEDQNATGVDAAVLETKTSILSRFKDRYGSQKGIGSEPGQNWLSKKVKGILDLPDVKGMMAVTTLTLCDVLDGGEPNGPMKKYVYRVLKAADDRKNERLEKATVELDTLIKKHFTQKEFAKLKKEKVYIKSLDREMTKDEILAVGLNWGNDTNRRRIIDGYRQTVKENGVVQYNERKNPITRPMNETEMAEIVSHLSERDLDFCQDVWDHLETYWPEIFNLEVQVAGLEPKKVPALAFEAYGKKYRGGYYPIDYDATRSIRMSESDKHQNALYKTSSGTMLHTAHGHTEARVRSVRRPINLDTNVLFEHVNNVIHDLSFRKAVIDVNRFLSKSEISDAISNSLGKKALQTLKDSLNFIASDQRVQQTDFERNILKPLRSAATYSVLGFKFLSVPVDISGNLINLASERGFKALGDLTKSYTFLKGTSAEVGIHLAQVMPDVVGKPLASMIESTFEDSLAWKGEIHDKSIRMRKRAKLINRDLYDLSKTLRGETSTYKRFAFMTQVFADEMISQPLWSSVYKESINKGFSEVDSIHLADESVTSTFGSGSSVDLSAVQRGGEFQRLLTYWYSWNGMMFNRMWKDGKISGQVGSWEAAYILGKTLAFSIALHGLNEWLWKDYIFRNSTRPDRKEDERMLSRVLRQGAGYIPVIGPVIDYAIDRSIMKDHQSHLSLPIQSAVETIYRPIDDFFNKKPSESWDNYLTQERVEHILNAGSMVTGKWPKQLNILLFNYADSLNRDDLRKEDWFTRRIKK